MCWKRMALTTTVRALQWGRDVSVADVAIHLAHCLAQLPGFNGAATFPSRMWHHASQSERRGSCFNGAATFPSRMFIVRRLIHDALQRFNGAATFPSRM